jgi:hypothetical protein
MKTTFDRSSSRLVFLSLFHNFILHVKDMKAV